MTLNEHRRAIIAAARATVGEPVDLSGYALVRHIPARYGVPCMVLAGPDGRRAIVTGTLGHTGASVQRYGDDSTEQGVGKG